METVSQEESAPQKLSFELWWGLKQNTGALIGLGLITFFVLMALLAPLLAPSDPTTIHPEHLRLPPLWSEGGLRQFPLGTDDVGRDTATRLLYGARISIIIGLSVVFLSLVIGVFLGLVSGYYGGIVDRILMRLIDILMAFPSTLLAIVIVSVMGPGIRNAVIAVAIVAVPAFARIVRASVLAEKRKKYVLASKTFGATSMRIMCLEILPNCMAPLIVQATLGISDGILNTAALGFLGLGAQPPLPEWGTMLADGRDYIYNAPWLVTLPGLCILMIILGFNLFGDGLRDILDPRLKK